MDELQKTEHFTGTAPPDGAADVRKLYLDLMKNCLTFALWDAKDGSIKFGRENVAKRAVKALLGRNRRQQQTSPATVLANRQVGRDWPVLAHTMIGMKRMENLQFCVEDVLHRNLPGDLIETGVWRGGATIFMRAVLAAYGDETRRVWCADSFRGLPSPNVAQYPIDQGASW